MSSLLDILLDRGFEVFLASDHGNIETIGCGAPRRVRLRTCLAGACASFPMRLSGHGSRSGFRVS